MGDRKPPRVHPAGSPEGRLGAALLAGDAAEVYAARAALVASVDKWLWRHARGWWLGAGMRGEVSDFHQAAVLEAWKSAHRFDPGRGIKFISYVTRALKFGLARLAANEAGFGVHSSHKDGVRHVPTMHFSAIAADDGTDYAGGVPGAPEPEPAPDAAGVWGAVRAALAGHPKAARLEEAVWLRYGVGCTLEEIGDRFGVTKEAVRQWLRQALGRLRERGAAFAGWR